MSPLSPFLAPERDPAFKLGRIFPSGGTAGLSIPGAVPLSVTTSGTNADADYYFPFWLHTPLVVTSLVAEVTTLVAASNFRMGLYAADTNLQPVGAPLADSGNISSATTGVKTYTPGSPLVLPRGRYVGVMNQSSGTVIFRVVRGAFLGGMIQSTLTASPFAQQISVNRAFGAFPTPGTAWTTLSNAASNLEYAMFLSVSGP